MTHKIALYTDYVFNNAAVHKRAQDLGSVTIIGPQDIAEDYLAGQNPDILIMPGGADLYYCAKLNGENNAKIRDYVAKGGAYFGICAGAYYGCNALKWLEGTDMEISGPRELAFAPATAIGPIDEFVGSAPERHWDSPRIARLSDTNSTTMDTIYYGGPCFDLADDHYVSVLATYPDLDNSPAIIAGMHQNGRYVLSSPHIEYTWQDAHAKSNSINKGDFYLSEEEIGRLEAGEKPLRKLRSEVWSYLTGGRT